MKKTDTLQVHDTIIENKKKTPTIDHQLISYHLINIEGKKLPITTIDKTMPLSTTTLKKLLTSH